MGLPLNGTKTHPLSKTALDVLAGIAVAPVPRQVVNPGVVNRLTREHLVEVVDLPSPYKTVRGTVEHLRITPAGREALKQAKPSLGEGLKIGR